MVDSADHDRFEEARDEFHKILKEEELRNSLFMVLANKRDLPNAVSPDEVSKLQQNRSRCSNPSPSLQLYCS